MAFDYAKAAGTAQRLLASFGQTVTLSREAAGSYDPVTGETTGGGEETQTCKAALLPYKDGDSLLESGMVQIGDRKLLIEAAGLSWPPDALTKLTDVNGQVWQVEKVRELAPAGIPVLYTANGTR